MKNELFLLYLLRIFIETCLLYSIGRFRKKKKRKKINFFKKILKASFWLSLM